MPDAAPSSPPAADVALIDAMRRVVDEEAEALRVMARGIDAGWLAALRVLDAVRRAGGRIIVSGVGKSGHVGRKIAATLASTGAPAFFVHGAEASHGDLGMVLEGDAVLLLSASGGTRELLDIAHDARRRALPLLIITRKAEGELARLADHVLLLPDVPEACLNGQAPTTSSTATLAAGDALAVALMRLAGFTAEDFRRRHPGGQLGLARS
ncbi:MAG: SIS domain-containing protein [Bosea sp.]|jgi:arabinose-5-phosphate isomerase|nr:SIS domain-containing protein [Bosea sp. (in: a-proteobacteria)]